MKMSATPLVIFLSKLILLMCWPPTAYAAFNLMETFAGYDFVVLAILAFISTLAGLTSLALRLDKALRETGKPLVYPWIFVGSHMLASWCGAMLAVLIAIAGEISEATLLLMVLVFSFAGVKALEGAAESIIGKYLPTNKGSNDAE